MSVGIVGGGLLGLRIADRLAHAGVPVTVYERGRRLGGLAGTTRVGGVAVDRYYHAVTLTDRLVTSLADELDIGVRWRPLGVGFFHDGRLCSMSTPRELLAFPGLRPDDKARLAAFVAVCRATGNSEALDDVPIEQWVRRTAGRRLWERLWRPLLESKFDGTWDDLPATYLWSRVRRTAGTRDNRGRELMGWLEGGYQALVDGLVARIRGAGGEVLTSSTVHAVPASPSGRALGVVVDDGGLHRHDLVVTTQLRPVLDELLGRSLVAALGPDPNHYLGIVCVVARVRRSVSPYYALQITDRRVPITSVVETTHVVDPAYAEGHLLYVPRYVRAGSEELERPAAELADEYLGHVRTLFPEFREEDVIATQVARTAMAEPVHVVGARPRHPEVFPAPGLVVASSALVHPDIVFGQAVFGAADRIAAQVLSQTPSLIRQRSVA